MKDRAIPKFGATLLRLFIHPMDREHVLAAFDDKFALVCEREGWKSAHLWFWAQVLQSILPFIKIILIWSVEMFINYLKVTLRNIKKNKIYSLINISGLSIGMAGFMVFAFIAGTNFHADEFHEHAERIFGIVVQSRTQENDTRHSTYISGPLLPTLLNEYPEIEAGVNIMPAGRLTVKHLNDNFFEENVLFADSNFFTFFSFKMIQGDTESVLADPFSIVLSEAAAEKYFGSTNSVGKFLTINKDIELRITGIFKIPEGSSSLQFSMVISMDSAPAFGRELDNWEFAGYSAFVRLPDGFNKDDLESQFEVFKERFIPDSEDEIESIYLFPLLDFRLESNYMSTLMLNTMKGDQYGFMAIGIVLLLVVSINFTNLSTTRYMSRVKEIGIRQVVGARRSQLIRQFFGESFIFALLSLPIAIIFFHIFMTAYAITFLPDARSTNFFTEHTYVFKYVLKAALGVGFLSGLYPALFLSSLNPVAAFKGTPIRSRSGIVTRKMLVTLQFVFSVILIVLSITLEKQFDYLVNANLGFGRNDVGALQIAGLKEPNITRLKSDLLQRVDVISASISVNVPVWWTNEMGVVSENGTINRSMTFDVYGVDNSIVETLDLNVISGKDFGEDSYKQGNVLINKAAVDYFEWANPIGKRLKYGGITGTVIGVVNDFQFRYVGNPRMMPSILYVDKQNPNYLLIEAQTPSQLSSVSGFLKDNWNEYSSDIPFSFLTLDNHFNDKYTYINTLAILCKITGGLAVFFSCLGLLGLVSYTVERKTKEIGVRKVLGASLYDVTMIFLKDFLILIGISYLISIPLSYWLSDSLIKLAWSRYNTDIGTGTFMIAVFFTLGLTLIAVFSQTMRAANANPVDSLRDE